MATAPSTFEGLTAGRIELHLPDVGDLFNRLDPSPFIGRDLAVEVVEYIVETAEDAPPEAPLSLEVVLPPPVADSVEATGLEAAIRAYFVYERDRQLKRVRRLLREGRTAAFTGVAFLVVCIALAQVARSVLQPPVGDVLREGLMIIGWVANWRPVEIFLYDWRPMRRRARLYHRLAQVAVSVRDEPRIRS